MAYDNTNSGALFKNDKEGNESRPDYKGKINVDGKDYWLSAWIKEGKSGKFMSLSVKPQDASPSRRQAEANDPDNDLPF